MAESRSFGERTGCAPPATADATPVAWRAAAALLLVGGVAAGDRLSSARTRSVTALAGTAAAVTVALVLAGDRRAARLACDGTPPTCLPLLDVLIPARDEAAALPRLIADLARQDLHDPLGGPLHRIVVIDDRSIDGTGDAARDVAERHGVGALLTVVRREPGSLPDGKGSALAAADAQIRPGAAVVVLDADARVGKSFLRDVATRLGEGTPALTVRRRVYRADASLLAAAQAAELDLDALQLRARVALGGAGEFRGNGMAMTPESLRAAGGWAPGALTEDLELSTRLARLGRPVAWAPEPVAWEAPTATFRALGRQRVRWAEGSLRRLFGLLPATLASRHLPLAAKLDLAAYAGQALLPPMIVGTAAGGLRRRRLRVPLALVAAYGSAPVMLTLAAPRHGVAIDPEALPSGLRADDEVTPLLARKPIRAGLAGLLSIQWLLAVPVALMRITLRPGRTSFDRTRDRLL